MPSRNIILIVGLALFLVGYVFHWAYHSLYLEPRERLGNEITRLSGEIEAGRGSHAAMSQFCQQNMGFFYRTLPQTRNDAQSQYSFWLLELLLYSGFEENHVNPVANPIAVFPFGWNFQFNIQSTGSLEQLSYFLFEFYYAPFLHRITSMTLAPTDGNAEQLSVSLTVNALALDLGLFHTMDNALGLQVPFFPLPNQLPTGWTVSRLAFMPQSATHENFTAEQFALYRIIANRNLLQTARGGIDRADFTFLTGIVELDGQTEAWFSVRTDDSRITARLGDPVQSGSFSGRLVEILDRDIVLERDGERGKERWLLTTGESLNQAFALPPETSGRRE